MAVWLVFTGRTLQAIGATAAWVVGLATLRNSIDGKHMGKAFGLVLAAHSVGALAGPAVSGVLLDLTSYWMTWLAALLVLAVDIVMRLFLEDPKPQSVTQNDMTRQQEINVPIGDYEDHANLDSRTSITHNATTYDEQNEGQALIHRNGHDRQYGTLASATMKHDSPEARPSALHFYKLMLTQRRALIGLLCGVMSTLMVASFSTTIPIHVRLSFGWSSFETGLLFVALQGPSLVLSPLCGYLRDKVGTRLPATAGFFILAPLLWLLGAANQQPFPWATNEEHAKRVYVATVIGIGCVTNLMAGIATIEMTGKSQTQLPTKSWLTLEICS